MAAVTPFGWRMRRLAVAAACRRSGELEVARRIVREVQNDGHACPLPEPVVRLTIEYGPHRVAWVGSWPPPAGLLDGYVCACGADPCLWC